MAKPNPLDGAQEIQQMLIAYAKQETIAPLKTLGRYLGFGMAGALFVFLGAAFVGLGVLRLLQTFEVFSGSSWASTVPYLLTILALTLMAAIILAAMSRAKKKVS